MKKLFLKRWGSEKAKRLMLSILFVGDDEMRRLNQKYRKKNKPTDVLSFPSYEIGALKRPRCEAAGEGRLRRTRLYAAGVPTRATKQMGLFKAPVSVGDIVISVDTARRYAKRDEMTYEDKMKFLLIHGFLHLLGYDHEISKKEEIRMQKKEREYAKILEGI